MHVFALPWVCRSLRCLGILGIACIAFLDTSCSKRKDGVIVEISDELAKSGVAVRDWRRSGLGVLDVQIFTEVAIPGNAWTLAAYDKDGNLLTAGRIAGPKARVGDTVWIRLATPYRDLFDKANRVVVGADLTRHARPVES
ncbi:MAG TPA: hypothetical protein VKE94_00920 [Gemmataceae bacterium]|nr:hypothetical protein [Gemmataceae bacterium]